MLGQLEDVATTPFHHRGAGFGSHRGDGCTGAATVLDPMVWGRAQVSAALLFTNNKPSIPT